MKKSPEEQKKMAMMFAVGAGIVGIAVWRLFLVDLFEPPKNGEINYARVLGAAIVGGGSSLIGLAVGRAFAKK